MASARRVFPSRRARAIFPTSTLQIGQSMTAVEIKLNAGNRNGSVLVDGQDVGKYVRGLKFVAGVGKIPQLTLDLAVFDVSTIDVEQAQLLIDPAVAGLLERAGWTPPGPMVKA